MSWYVAMAKGGSERVTVERAAKMIGCAIPRSGWVSRTFVAASELRQRGITVYAPAETRWVRDRHTRRNERRFFPLFGPYLFFACRPDPEDWRRVSACKTIHSLLGAEDHPIRLGDDDIETLIDAERDGLFDLTKMPEKQRLLVKVGEVIIFQSGPLCGMSGVVRTVPKTWGGGADVDVGGISVRAPLDIMRIAA